MIPCHTLCHSCFSSSSSLLRFLKVNYVKDVMLLGQAEEEFELKNPYLDMTSLRNREEAAIRYFFSFILKSSSLVF
jgi:hypothetical protein